MLINTRKLEYAKRFIELGLKNRHEHDFIPIIEHFCKVGAVCSAAQYLDRIQTPGTKVRLQTMIQKKYLERLSGWVDDDEKTEILKKIFAKFIKFKTKVKNDESQISANHLKNEIIVELRHILDKAFKSFCEQNYGIRPDSKRFYFPLVYQDDLRNISIKNALCKKLKCPNFDRDFPALFDFLFTIQPVHNSNFLWLYQLFDLANDEKHGSKHVPLDLSSHGVELTAEEFLTKAIDGVVQCLIKLKNHNYSPDLLSRLCPSLFIHFKIDRAVVPAILINDKSEKSHYSKERHSQASSERFAIR